MRLLHVDSSVLGSNSVSRTLSAEIVSVERQRHPGLQVTYRDLAAEPLQHLTGIHVAVLRGLPVEVPGDLKDDLAYGAKAMEEFLAADIIVVGAPMYNFTVPSQLKSWIDRLCVAGKTFKYGPKGPEGLLSGKKMIIASTRGGIYGADTPMAFLDHQEVYLRAIFGFLGITDITFVRAEGLAMSDHRAKSIDSARAEIASLV
jgi:FMN-dependent NADH-azoreductase